MNKAEFDDIVRASAAVKGSRLMPRFMRHTASRWRALLVFAEMLLLAGAVFLAIYVRFISDPDPLGAYSTLWLQGIRALLFATMIVLGMTAMGLHQAQLRESWSGTLVRQATGFALGTFSLLVLYYAFPPLELCRGILTMALLFGFASVAVLLVA